MGHKNNIERNKIDYLLTDIMPVEISELYFHMVNSTNFF